MAPRHTLDRWRTASGPAPRTGGDGDRRPHPWLRKEPGTAGDGAGLSVGGLAAALDHRPRLAAADVIAPTGGGPVARSPQGRRSRPEAPAGSRSPPRGRPHTAPGRASARARQGAAAPPGPLIGVSGARARSQTPRDTTAGMAVTGPPGAVAALPRPSAGGPLVGDDDRRRRASRGQRGGGSPQRRRGPGRRPPAGPLTGSSGSPDGSHRGWGPATGRSPPCPG